MTNIDTLANIKGIRTVGINEIPAERNVIYEGILVIKYTKDCNAVSINIIREFIRSPIEYKKSSIYNTLPISNKAIPNIRLNCNISPNGLLLTIELNLNLTQLAD